MTRLEKNIFIFVSLVLATIPAHALAFDSTCDAWDVSGSGSNIADGHYTYDSVNTAANQILFSNSYLTYSTVTATLTITAYGRELHANPETPGVAYYYASVSGFQSGDFSGIDSVNASGLAPAPTIIYDGSGCGGGGGGGGGGGNGLQAALSAASSTMTATMGVDIQGVMDWAGENLIKLYAGSGLALLYLLRGWIVAFMIISAVLFFAYRAFRFFRH